MARLKDKVTIAQEESIPNWALAYSPLGHAPPLAPAAEKSATKDRERIIKIK